ncbi:hypothetical protein SAMN06265182_0392 [Persephonella hydrogeniphila]|uniref:Uncharacterized protein n=1 Tax=Persephonella hydrogeniphila TaxID=198703 RepID=A0A285N668_9AQUI|nr:hypothetical protein [Persephonella hydrogeniphila]SNZ03486.1 hypothetical protein SAMN06265182_0392 [Persephonella hydrogeniphila]
MGVFLVFLLIFSLSYAQHVKIISPDRNSFWVEGRSYKIKWKGDIKGKICISVLMGGKDRGTINDCKTDFSQKSFIWKIPEGFVTGFGINMENSMRIILFRRDNPEKFYKSDFFTISGYELKDITAKSPEEAIKLYFDSISEGDFDTAYNILSKCKIIIKQPDGEGFGYTPPPVFLEWKRQIKTFVKNIKLLDIKELKIYSGKKECIGEKVLGIRRFKVKLILNSKKEDRFIDLIKGTDGNYRILGIGTGP